MAFKNSVKLCDKLCVTLWLNLSDGNPVEAVKLFGNHAPLSWKENAGRELELSDGQIWKTTLGFPFGTPADVQFKFQYKSAGVWHWESMPGHINHITVIDPTAKTTNLDLFWSAESFKLETQPSSELEIDNMDALSAVFGKDIGAWGYYGYMKAVRDLSNGNTKEAENTYKQWKSLRPDKDAINDFPFLLASHLQEKGNAERAFQILERIEYTAQDTAWRAQARYNKAMLLLNDGALDSAQTVLNSVLSDFREDTLATADVWNYSRLMLGQLYLNHPDIRKRKYGVSYLRAAEKLSRDPRMKRSAQMPLLAAAEKGNNQKEVARLIKQLGKDADRAYSIGLTKRWVDFERKAGHGHKARMLADSLLSLYLPDVVAQESPSDSSVVMMTQERRGQKAMTDKEMDVLYELAADRIELLEQEGALDRAERQLARLEAKMQRDARMNARMSEKTERLEKTKQRLRDKKQEKAARYGVPSPDVVLDEANTPQEGN